MRTAGHEVSGRIMGDNNVEILDPEQSPFSAIDHRRMQRVTVERQQDTEKTDQQVTKGRGGTAGRAARNPLEAGAKKLKAGHTQPIKILRISMINEDKGHVYIDDAARPQHTIRFVYGPLRRGQMLENAHEQDAVRR